MSSEADSVAELPKFRHRSPNHPSLSLEDAITKATELWGHYKNQPAPILAVVSKLGYSTLNSSANQTVAALKAYGLVDVHGSGDTRKVAISDTGARIIRRAPDRESLIRNAALMPQIHQEVLQKYDGILPHDDVLHNYLVWERPEGQRFNEESVGGFIQRLQETCRFAGLEKEHPAAPTIDTDRMPPAEITPLQSKPTASAHHEPQSPATLMTESSSVLNRRTERWELNEGPLVIEYPRELSLDSVDDLEYFLRGVMQRMRRNAARAERQQEQFETD